MKYLKSFNESLISDDVIDMMLEISDMGYQCSVDFKWTGGGPSGGDYKPNQDNIQISIKHKGRIGKIIFREVMPTINRIVDYLSETGYQFEDEITIRPEHRTGYEDVSLDTLNSMADRGYESMGPVYFYFKRS